MECGGCGQATIGGRRQEGDLITAGGDDDRRHRAGQRVAHRLTAGSLTAYVGFFAIGLGPVFWLLISEIFPQSVRGRGMSIATVANWVFNLAVALTFLSMVDGLGRPATFFIYAALTVAAFLFTLRLVPETAGRSLEDVQGMFAPKPPTGG